MLKSMHIVERSVSGRLARLLVLGVAALVPLACGQSGPEMASVSGTVTLDGKPVPKGTISFVPEKGGRSATGEIQSDGSYTLQTDQPGDGAELGPYKVAVVSREEVVLDYIPPKPIPPKRLVPEKFENPDTSGLRAEVKSGSNSFDFDLKP